MSHPKPAIYDDRFAVFLRLLTETGRRRDEVRKLRWADVDMDACTITCGSTTAGEPGVWFFSPETAELLARVWPKRETGEMLFASMSEPKPARCLPAWALEFFEQWRARSGGFVGIDEEMEHRRAAFYRLYTADDPAIREVWRYVDTSIATDERGGFLHDLIMATDWILPDEPLPVYGAPDYQPPRLRTREQRKARKLAELLQLLRSVTPSGCAARTSNAINTGTHIEALIIRFNIGQVPPDHDQRWQLTGLRIEYTANSKRGWMQHRRASDTVRHKAVKAARELAALPDAARHAPWLCGLAEALETLPAMETEHRGDLWRLSRKAGYLDWLRPIMRNLDSYAAHPHTPALRQTDLATLANLLTCPNRGITEDDIAHATTAPAGILNNLHS